MNIISSKKALIIIIAHSYSTQAWRLSQSCFHVPSLAQAIGDLPEIHTWDQCPSWRRAPLPRSHTRAGLSFQRNVPFPLGLHLPPLMNKLTNLNTLIQETLKGLRKLWRQTGVEGMECGVYDMGHEEGSSNKYSLDTLIQLELSFMHKHVLLWN